MENNSQPIKREHIPSLLFEKYRQDFNLAAAEFPQDHRIEFVEHLIAFNALAYAFCLDNNPDLYKQCIELESNFIKRHGKVAKTYKELKMYDYFDDVHVLINKEIYTVEQWNNLSGDMQKISTVEMQKFMALCDNFLFHEREYLWLEQSPEYLTTEAKNPQNPLAGTAIKAAEEAENKRRMALDKATVLSQEQTVLLLHYLKEIKVFLREHNLNNKDAGIAFGILTGYSHDTIRQKLGRVESIQSHDNLEFLYNYMVRLLSAIEKDLNKKNKPG